MSRHADWVSTPNAGAEPIAVRAVMPELPHSSVWMPYLQPAIDANWFTNFGPVNAQFEKRLAGLYARVGEIAVTAASATAGLSTCLIAENISGPVLCPAFTFQATAGAILAAGCQPVIVDVDLRTGVVTPETLRAALQETGARAAMVLAPYGIATDFSAHAAVCRQHNALLVIDNAAGLGVDRRRLDYCPEQENVREVFSLHATKPFGIGEGGVILAPVSAETALRSAMNFGLSTHSATGGDKPPYWGINGKMSEVHAAIGLAVADTIADRVTGRQDMVRMWIEALQAAPVRMFSTDVAASPWQVFPILLKDEGQTLSVVAEAAKRGIELRRYYSPSLGDCAGMARYKSCPNAADLADRAVVLPVRSYLAEADRAALIHDIREILQ